MPAPRLIRRVVLERCSRPLLARLLATHGAAFFTAHDFSLDALAASPVRDRALVHRLYDLLHDRALSPALPPALRALLGALDALATPAGGEAILRADEKRLLPRATYGDEDLALVLLLEHPELAVEARREAEADEVQSFTVYEPAEPRALAYDADTPAALARALGPGLEARGRTSLCHVHARRDGDVVSLEVVHARRPKTFDKVDARSLEIDQSTDIHTERGFVELDLRTGAAAVHAARGIKELVRDALGVVVAGSASYFKAARTYDLSPFAHLPEALSTEGASRRLSRVELHAIYVMTANGGTTMGFTRARKDLLLDEEARDALDAALRAGRPVAVKVYLFIEGRKNPLCVELSTKGGKNLVDFDRSDPEVVEIVLGYLRARGVLRDGAAPEVKRAPPREPLEAGARDAEEARAEASS